MPIGITVFFETDNAIFRFTVDDVMDHLNRNQTEYDAKEVTALRDLLSSVTEDSMTIPKDHRFFPYVALNLIKDSKATVYCRSCEKSYEAAELKLVRVGHGETPFSPGVIGKGWLRKLFGKKERLPLFGGRGYQCPEGDELIALVTWRT